MYKNNYPIEQIKKYENKEKKEHILDIIRAITTLSLSCFIMALLYDFQYPTDDGSCSFYNDNVSCLNKKLIFDSRQTYCKWIPASSPGYLDIIKDNTIIETIQIADLINNLDTKQCFYNENNSSIQTIIITIIITIASSVPLDICSSKLIDFLRAETKQNQKINPNLNLTNINPNIKQHNTEFNNILIKQLYYIPEELCIIKNELNKLFTTTTNLEQKNRTKITMNIRLKNNEYLDPIVKKIFKQFRKIGMESYGIGLLHTLYSDLIGQESYSEKIFSMFINKTFISEKYVDYKMKLFAFIMLTMINFGCVFYVALKGAIRGNKWQHIYINACIINWISDIFVVQLFEIFWLNFFVASLIRKKVLVITDFLISVCPSVYNKNNLCMYPNWLRNKILYSKIFTRFTPDSLESSLIQNIYDCKKYNDFNNNNKIFEKSDTIFTILFGIMPLELHRILSSFLASILIVIFIVIWYKIKIIIFIIVLISLFATIGTIGYFKNKKQLSRIIYH
jgi:hypothetical protein